MSQAMGMSLHVCRTIYNTGNSRHTWPPAVKEGNLSHPTMITTTVTVRITNQQPHYAKLSLCCVVKW